MLSFCFPSVSVQQLCLKQYCCLHEQTSVRKLSVVSVLLLASAYANVSASLASILLSPIFTQDSTQIQRSQCIVISQRVGKQYRSCVFQVVVAYWLTVVVRRLSVVRDWLLCNPFASCCAPASLMSLVSDVM